MSTKIGGGGHQENYGPSNGRYCSSTTVDWYDQKQMYAKIEEKSEAYLANSLIKWAKKKYKRLLRKGNKEAKKFNTASIAYDSANDRIYHGINGGISDLSNLCNEMQNIANHVNFDVYAPANCAEYHAIDKALRCGSKLKDISY